MTAAQNISQLLTGYKWTTSTVTYSFITEYAPYTPESYQEPGGPTVLSEALNGVFGSIQQASDFII